MVCLKAAASAASLLLSPVVSAYNAIDLSGNDWTLSNAALNISVPGHLPSQAHLDLYAAGVIGDPYHDLNDFNLRWVAWNNWTYTSATISGLSSNASSTWLQFNGLDTFTSISFCGQHVASTNNQFRQWWFDISNIFSSCSAENAVLAINFGSAPTIANEIAASPDAETWPEGIQLTYEFPNRWFIRKEQSDFGWDWGPAFAPAGPWMPAYVVQLGEDQVHIRNSDIDIYRQGQLNLLPPDQSQNWVVNASVDYFGQLRQGAKLNYVLKDSENSTISSGPLGDVNATESSVTGSTVVPKDSVELWWPSGLGPQNLYWITIDVVSSDNKTLDSVTKRTGFRTIVLNENPISEEQLAQGIANGNNWHFEVNGHEFYAKGSNFIPPDAFWPRVTVEKMTRLMNNVVDGNQNMLRVWSSGAYTPDYIFDLADERGILLWSEFEFGDCLYPVDQDFLDNVREEADYNVRRVNHHPSLALWAGGNELENLILPNVNDTAPEQFDRYQREYETLFLDTLTPAVFENSRSISYTPSSTSNGWASLNFSNPVPIVERYYNTTPGYIYGETDFYNYDPAVLGNDSAYPVGRFSNEFGFHSMPSIQTWREQISPEYLSFNSSVVTLRDHHPPSGNLNISNYANASVGQAQMTEAVELWYPVPDKSDLIANFSAWIYATQIFQADLYTSQIAFYRRGSGLPERQLGSLYWQLEDIWAAPTWASIEYSGRWKPLHHAARSYYSPVIITPHFNSATGNFSVWVTSDLWSPVSGSATLSWYNWNGEPLDVANATTTLDFTVGAINSTKILQTFTQDALGGVDPSEAVLKMNLTATGSLPNSPSNSTPTVFKHENWFHASPLNNASLTDPVLEVTYSNSTQNFTVSARNGVAAYVWLDHPGDVQGHFSDNFFWLAKGESKEVKFVDEGDGVGMGEGWTDAVGVSSVWDLGTP